MRRSMPIYMRACYLPASLKIRSAGHASRSV